MAARSSTRAFPRLGRARSGYANIRIYRHVLGRDAAKDEIVFAPGVGGARDVPEFVRPSIYIPPDSRDAYAIARDGAATRDRRDHVTELRDLAEAKPALAQDRGLPGRDRCHIVGSGRRSLPAVAPGRAAPQGAAPEGRRGSRDGARRGPAGRLGDPHRRASRATRSTCARWSRASTASSAWRVGLLGNTKAAEYVRTPFDTSIAQLRGQSAPSRRAPAPPGLDRAARDRRGGRARRDPADRAAIRRPPAAAGFDAMDEVRLYAPAPDGTKIPVTLIYRKTTHAHAREPDAARGLRQLRRLAHSSLRCDAPRVARARRDPRCRARARRRGIWRDVAGSR